MLLRRRAAGQLEPSPTHSLACGGVLWMLVEEANCDYSFLGSSDGIRTGSGNILKKPINQEATGVTCS